MQLRRPYLASILALVACSRLPSPLPPLDVKPEDNGQTGSSGGRPLCTDESCGASWQDWLAKLESSKATLPTRFSKATCEESPPPYFDTAECHCTSAEGEVIAISPSTYSCVYGLRGRGGFCLWNTGEVPTCDRADPAACESTCTELERRLTADANQKFDGDIRFARCATPGLWPGEEDGRLVPCSVVARINGQCYTNDSAGFIDPMAYDCTLDDAEILRRAATTGVGVAGASGVSGMGAVARGGAGGTGGVTGPGGVGGTGAGGVGGTSGSGQRAGAGGNIELPPEADCEQTIETFCAAPRLGSPPCIMDWAEANDPTKWCGAGSYVEFDSCDNGYNQISRITGFGDDAVSLVYYYEESSGRLAHISRVPLPSRLACIAGDRTLRLNERICPTPTAMYSCEQ